MLFRFRSWFWFLRRSLKFRLISRTNTLILVTGMPRSGSTFIFNICKLLLIQSGKSVITSWVNDTRLQFKKNAVFVVKIHDYDRSLARLASVIIHSSRDIKEIAASQMAKEQQEPTIEELLKLIQWDKAWKKEAKLQIDFNELGNINGLIEKIGNGLGITSIDFEAILEKIKRLNSNPETYEESSSLFYPNHKSGMGNKWEEVLSKELIEKLDKI